MSLSHIVSMTTNHQNFALDSATDWLYSYVNLANVDVHTVLLNNLFSVLFVAVFPLSLHDLWESKNGCRYTAVCVVAAQRIRFYLIRKC